MAIVGNDEVALEEGDALAQDLWLGLALGALKEFWQGALAGYDKDDGVAVGEGQSSEWGYSWGWERAGLMVPRKTTGASGRTELEKASSEVKTSWARLWFS